MTDRAYALVRFFNGENVRPLARSNAARSYANAVLKGLSDLKAAQEELRYVSEDPDDDRRELALDVARARLEAAVENLKAFDVKLPPFGLLG